MAFAVSCSKYKSRKQRELEQAQKDFDSQPLKVASRKELSCSIPPEIRQFPVVSPINIGAGGNIRPGSATVSSGRTRGGLNSNFYGESPRPLYRHNKDSEALNAGTPVPSSGAPIKSGHRTILPASYESSHWQSMTKDEFQKPQLLEGPSKALQEERKRNMRSSAVTVGDPKSVPFEKSTQSRDSLPQYDRSRYVCHSSYPIGGPHRKNASAVPAKETVDGPDHYETLARRQFTRLPITNQGGSHNNKADNNKSHWSTGCDRTEYITATAVPLPSTQPTLKNRPPSATAPANNPFLAKTAADARPRQLEPSEAAAQKCRSCIPLSGGNALPPGAMEDGTTVAKSNGHQKGKTDDTGATVLSRNMTTTGASFPAFQAIRREAIDIKSQTRMPTDAAGDATNNKNRVQSSISIGTDSVKYVPASRSQFKGVYFGN